MKSHHVTCHVTSLSCAFFIVLKEKEKEKEKKKKYKIKRKKEKEKVRSKAFHNN